MSRWTQPYRLERSADYPLCDDVLAAFDGYPPQDIVEARTRIVLLYESVVVKIPRNEEGILANSMELSTYLDPQGIPVAPVCGFNLDGMLVTVMERVSPHPNAFGDRGLPWWVGCVDCGQVGYRDSGELVAYDL